MIRYSCTGGGSGAPPALLILRISSEFEFRLTEFVAHIEKLGHEFFVELRRSALGSCVEDFLIHKVYQGVKLGNG